MGPISYYTCCVQCWSIYSTQTGGESKCTIYIAFQFSIWLLKPVVNSGMHSYCICRGPACLQMAQCVCSDPRHCPVGCMLFLRGAYVVVLFSSNVDRVDVDRCIGRCFARHKTVRNSPLNAENQLEWSNAGVPRCL